MTSPQLHFERCGKSRKTPVVLLHGFLGSSADWQDVIERLGATFNFLTIDLPGHGQSRDIGLNLNFDQTAAAIIDILFHERIRTCPILGYSMGGRIALYTAIKYPQHFSYLILESCNPGIKTKSERERRTAFDDDIRQKLHSMSLPDFLQDWYQMPLFAGIQNKPHFAEMIKQRAETDPSALGEIIKNLGAGAMPSLWKNFQNLDIPIHYIYGVRDTKYKNIAQAVLDAGKNISLYTIKNSGHNTHFENPQEFCTILESIFKDEE